MQVFGTEADRELLLLTGLGRLRLRFRGLAGITFSGVIGYRALSVDYAQGEGRRRYEFDMALHGPVVGLSMRF